MLQAPYTVAAPISPFISRGHIKKQYLCARVRATLALANASSFCASCSLSSRLRNVLLLPPMRKPIFFLSKEDMVSCHSCTRGNTPLDDTAFWGGNRFVECIYHIISVMRYSQAAMFSCRQGELRAFHRETRGMGRIKWSLPEDR